jgi:putative transposase
MSRRGNCWDNSVMERFFRSLKSERLNHLSFIHHVAAVSTVESYIYFYNYKRLHSTLGYITPVQKMAELKKRLKVTSLKLDQYKSLHINGKDWDDEVFPAWN